MFKGVYISESVHPKIRVSLLVLPNMFFSFGMLFVWTVSYFCSWRITAYINMTIPALMITILLVVPIGYRNQASVTEFSEKWEEIILNADVNPDR